MNKELENLISEDLKYKIIEVSLKLENSIILMNMNKNLCIPISKENIENYDLAIKEGLYKEVKYSRSLNFFKDFYNQIDKYNSIEHLFCDENIKYFGDIKIRFLDDSNRFYCHINSKKYNGNACHHEKWKAILLAFHDALYN